MQIGCKTGLKKGLQGSAYTSKSISYSVTLRTAYNIPSSRNAHAYTLSCIRQLLKNITPDEEKESHSRHPHRKEMDGHIRIEWLHHIFRDQRLVHRRVLVLLEFWQSIMANVDHVGGQEVE